jgi:hypothetical protein
MFLSKFESRHERLAPAKVFVARVISSLGVGLGLLAVALAIGILGYHWIAKLPWIDALLEASMILGGMGPVQDITPKTPTAAKIFASVYALFSGVIFIALMGIVLTPLAHRMMHRFHLEKDDDDKA